MWAEYVFVRHMSGTAPPKKILQVRENIKASELQLLFIEYLGE